MASTVDTILIVKAVGQYHLMSFCYFKYFVYYVTEECCPSNVSAWDNQQVRTSCM